MEIVNIAAYKFVAMPQELEPWRTLFKELTAELCLKGTILLAPEGINLFLAGPRQAIDSFLKFLREDAQMGGRFTDIIVKESLSGRQPFGKMLVKLKKEIITMRHPTIVPEQGRAPVVDPHKLKTWLDQGHDDEGRKVVMLDTRNEYEVEYGTFSGAVDLKLENFGEFPSALQAARQNDEQLRDSTIVSFCTGGIRCEKAVLYMHDQLEMRNVFQLEGGILGYFKKVGADHYQGSCFVFDERRALDPNSSPVSGSDSDD